MPSVAELGFKDYGAEVWIGLVAPAKTPQDRISQLASWLTAALQVPEVKPKLAVQGLFPKPMCGAEYGAYLRAQHDEYARVIREAGIKAE